MGWLVLCGKVGQFRARRLDHMSEIFILHFDRHRLQHDQHIYKFTDRLDGRAAAGVG